MIAYTCVNEEGNNEISQKNLKKYHSLGIF